MIQLAWATLDSLEKQRRSYEPNEADWRLPIDLFIQHIFGQTDGKYHTSVLYVSFLSITPSYWFMNKFSREARLHLVHSANKTIEMAIADAVVVLELPNHVRGLAAKWRPECCCLPGARLTALHILHFVSEKKQLFSPASGRNQLIYGLSTGLFQKRGLGLTDQLVFGCCTESDEILAYAGSWDGEQVRIQTKDFPVLLIQPNLWLEVAQHLSSWHFQTSDPSRTPRTVPIP
jgi:hypothetical protein